MLGKSHNRKSLRWCGTNTDRCIWEEEWYRTQAMFYMYATYKSKAAEQFAFASKDFKRGYDVHETIIYYGKHQQSASSCQQHFQDFTAIHICLSYTQIPKTNTPSSSTESGLLLSHMLSCADTAVSIWARSVALSYTPNVLESLPQSAASRCWSWTVSAPTSTIENNQAFLLD